GQVAWLTDAIKALDAAKDPKLRPIKKRMARLMFQFQRSVERGEDEATARARLGPEIDALLVQVFRSIVRALEQIAGAIRVKQARGAFGPAGAEYGKLMFEIQTGAKEFSALVDALRSGDASAARTARGGLQASSERMAAPIAAIAG
ncbi:MAG: hypothetical protein AAF658_22590, partial [Myxococcota bacterium]